MSPFLIESAMRAGIVWRGEEKKGESHGQEQSVRVCAWRAAAKDERAGQEKGFLSAAAATTPPCSPSLLPRLAPPSPRVRVRDAAVRHRSSSVSVGGGVGRRMLDFARRRATARERRCAEFTTDAAPGASRTKEETVRC